MPEFILDTSGRVEIHGRRATPIPAEFTAWDHLDGFDQGYIEALFFTENEPSLSRYDDGFRAVHPQEEDDETDDETAECEYFSRVREGQIKEIPGDYGFSDLAPEALDQIKADCAAFRAANAELLQRAYDHKSDYDEAAAGRDYWYTRNGHGVGYWDRDLGDIGDALSTAAGRSEVNAYIGDDGKVYV